MRKKMKVASLLFVLTGLLTLGGTLSACQKPTENGPRFLKGIDKEIVLGEGIETTAYIDRVAGSTYSVTVSKGDFFLDITQERYWEPDEPGVYTVTYTILDGNYAGVNSFELTVTAPELTWEYTLVNTLYDTGYELQFDEYFQTMNIAAQSYYPWKMVMDSVTFNDQTVDLTGETSWLFTEGVPHRFKFHIESEDGQAYSLSQMVEVRHFDQDMRAWMTSNDVTADGALRLESGQKVVFQDGTHNRSDNSAPDHATKYYMPYVSYNGEYGVGDYLVYEFTGNNLPYMLFFADEVTNSVWNAEDASAEENTGFLIANGWTTMKGLPVANWQNTTSMNARLSIYGPNKAYQMAEDKAGFLRKEDAQRPHPMSMYNLAKNENVNRKYRVIAGFSKGTATEFVFEMYAIDLTAGIELGTYVLKFKNTDIHNNKDGTIQFTDEMFKGKIALYGHFGRQMVLDKIYPIEQDTDMASLKVKYFSPSRFVEGARVSVKKGEIVNVSEYIAPLSGANWSLKAVHENGNEVSITGSTFSLDVPGNYTLFYNDGVNANGVRKLQVIDVDPTVYAWMQANNIDAYNLNAMSADRKTVLSAGTHGRNETDNSDYTNTHDVAYVAYKGNYGLNDFVVVDFTGNNMPTLSFFNDEVTNTFYYNPSATDAQNKGLIINNGVTDLTGAPCASWNKENSINDRLQLLGPTKAYWLGETVLGFRTNVSTRCPIGVYTLSQAANANRQYRLIAGFTAGSKNSCTVVVYVIDRQTGEEVLNLTKTVNQTFNDDSFNGSIALYGQFGKTLTLDNLYAIEQDTTLDALKVKYGISA